MAKCVKCDQPAALTYIYQPQGHANAIRYLGVHVEMCCAHFNQLLLLVDRFVGADEPLDVKIIHTPPIETQPDTQGYRPIKGPLITPIKQIVPDLSGQLGSTIVGRWP